ncbi:MAG: uroporphyrinogen decarboxylase family protein [Dehalococcoidia bacterium]
MQTTVVGAYPKIPNRPRPAKLRAAINKRDRGDITDEDLARVADEVTVEVIAEQIEAGLDIVTDGQIRWDDDQTYITRHMAGIEIGGLQRYLDTNTYYRQPEIVGAVGLREPVTVSDYKFAAENSSKPVKAVLPGPYTLAVLSLDKHYNNREKLVMALAEELRKEVDALAAAGATSIQVNDPMIAVQKDGAALAARALTKMLDGIDAETGVYTWFAGAFGILHHLLDTPADVIGLDFVWGPDSWEALKDVDFDKKLGFGIVDGRNTRLETEGEIADAIKRVSEFVPPERLYVNPSCNLEYLPRETAFDKLKTMVEGARKADSVPA